ncbi:hypothetical protein MiSe_93620 [Microseira wollei NIES-4236]|uniref:Transposase n=1 Tax=Microseira wollei NIES-4236 TaxID=2530354 RepID=A0AAV3XUP1_9CYAN|nr:hypothetical protein MiSe_93620 [Microseira wollei NIES-4236]
MEGFYQMDNPWKKGLNRAISDAAWNELILKLEYLAAKLRVRFV